MDCDTAIYIPNESAVHDVADLVTEAILLLDPTLASGTFVLAFSLTPHDQVIQAHSMLMSAAMKSIDIIAPYDTYDTDPNLEDQDETVNQLIGESVVTLADMYRALILSSYLQILRHLEATEFTSIQENELTISSGSHPMQSLLLTIQRCIALLQSLSFVVRQSQLYNFDTMGATHIKQKRKIDSGDWHDDFLPPPQHALLQDSFLRRDRVCLEDGIVFGKEERQVSLDFISYDVQSIDELHTTMLKYKKRTASQGGTSTTSFDLQEDSEELYEVDDTLMDGMNSQQLELEEKMLLDIAFPTSSSGPKRKHGSRCNTKYSSSMSEKTKQQVPLKRPNIHGTKVDMYGSLMNTAYTHKIIVQLSERYNIGRFVWNQYMYGPVCIRKMNWLHFHRMEQTQRNYTVLYATGLLLTFTDSSLSEVVTAYEISDISNCKIVSSGSILGFQLENVYEYDTKRAQGRYEQILNILIDMDDGCEDLTSQVNSWVQEVSTLVEYASMKKQHRTKLHSLWKK